MRLLSSLQVRRLREGAGDGLHCGFALTTGTDTPHTHVWSVTDRHTHTNPHTVNKLLIHGHMVKSKPCDDCVHFRATEDKEDEWHWIQYETTHSIKTH